MDNIVKRFGSFQGSPIILSNGSVVDKAIRKTSEKKESLRAVVTRIKQFSQQAYYGLFKKQFPETYDDLPFGERKVCAFDVHTSLDSATAAATNLKNRLIVHEQTLREEIRANNSIFACITDFFKRRRLAAFTELRKSLEEAEGNFKYAAREIPPIPLKGYTTKVDCLALLDAESTGFKEFPQAKKEALAEYMATNGGLELAEEGVVTPGTESKQFNDVVTRFLQAEGRKKGSAYDIVDIKHTLTHSTTLITAEQALEALAIIEKANPIDTPEKADALLKEIGFESYLDPKDYNEFRDTLMMQRFCLEDGAVLTTETDKTLFVTFICTYLRIRPKASDLPRFQNLRGYEFATLVDSRNEKRHTEDPITPDRASKLLHNLGYVKSQEVTTKLAQFLVGKELPLEHYAHLSSPEEIARFNALLIQFLEETALTSLDKLAIMTNHGTRESHLVKYAPTIAPLRAMEQIGMADVTEAYNVLTCRPVNKKRARALLEHLNIVPKHTKEQIEKLIALLVKKEQKVTTSCDLTDEGARTFEALYSQFLDTLPSVEPMDVDLVLLQIGLQEAFRANPSLPRELLLELRTHIINSQLHVLDPNEPLLPKEMHDLTEILFDFLSTKFTTKEAQEHITEAQATFLTSGQPVLQGNAFVALLVETWMIDYQASTLEPAFESPTLSTPSTDASSVSISPPTAEDKPLLTPTENLTFKEKAHKLKDATAVKAHKVAHAAQEKCQQFKGLLTSAFKRNKGTTPEKTEAVAKKTISLADFMNAGADGSPIGDGRVEEVM